MYVFLSAFGPQVLIYTLHIEKFCDYLFYIFFLLFVSSFPISTHCDSCCCRWSWLYFVVVVVLWLRLRFGVRARVCWLGNLLFSLSMLFFVGVDVDVVLVAGGQLTLVLSYFLFFCQRVIYFLLLPQLKAFNIQRMLRQSVWFEPC